MTVLIILISLVAILLAALFFTNAVEMLGDRLNIGQGAVGSVMAAFGTALPETMIPLVAIVGALILGQDPGAAGEIGVGAILGAPFLLATLAMLVVGASALGFRGHRESGSELTIDERTTSRDILFFLVFFFLASVAGVVNLPTYLRILLVIVLVGAYALYVWRTIATGGGRSGEAPQNLYLWPARSGAPTWAVVGQLVLALVVMVGAAHLFVGAIEEGSKLLGIPAGLISLILAPLATELPETFNSTIWLRDNKDTLALGNVTGAMVFQSTIPVCLGLLFTSWRFNSLDIFSVALALVSGAALFVMLRSKGPLNAHYLLGGGVMYFAFLIVAVVTVFF